MKNIVLYSILLIAGISCKKHDPPSGHIITKDVSEITETSAECGGKITLEKKDANANILQKGLIWSISKDNIQEFSNSNKKINNTPYQDDSNGFICQMTNLMPNTKYYVRAFAQIGLSERIYVYGEIKEFTTATTTITDTDAVDAVVQTLPVSNISVTTATLNGRIANAGAPAYSERGFCYSESSKEPTINDIKKTVANPVAIFTGQYSLNIDIEDFIADSHYYIRAYVIQNGKEFYGETVELSAISPVISNGAAYNITTKSAQFSINLSNAGIPACFEWGVCYSTKPDFSTKKYSKYTNSINAGNYTFTFNNLEPYTVYYYFAYVINSFDSVRTDTKSFTTLKSPPEVKTMETGNITPNSATIGGQIIFAGAPAYIGHGILCSWNNGFPTVDNFDYKEVFSGFDTGVFTVNLTNLIDGRT